MHSPVFISYVRKTHLADAERLHALLGGSVGLSFLDRTGIESGEQFPQALVEALLESRVVVVFLDDAYFASWYCLWEFRAALAPLLAQVPGRNQEAALDSIVLALPQGASRSLLDRLPPALRQTSWPVAEDTEQLAQLVRARLSSAGEKLGARLERSGIERGQVQSLLEEEAALPPPMSLGDFGPLYPLQRSPSLGRSFVGRAEALWRIHFTLSTLHGGTVGVAFTGSVLEGGGGFGKTRLALEYLHRLGPRYYPGGIFWVDADVSEKRREEQLYGILRALKPGAVPELVEFQKDPRRLEQELAQALHEASGRGPILYVIDNVPEVAPEARPQPLETWCPALGKVALLVTSRTQLLGVEGLQPIAVEELSPGAARALLLEGVKPQGLEEEGWRRIIEWVGALPLALELLNKLLKARVITPTELLERLKPEGAFQELERHGAVLQRHVTARASSSLKEVFQVSYERLSAQEQQAARLMAWLAPEPVPLELFRLLVPAEAFAGVRSTLAMRYFVRPVEEGPVAFFGTMHRLLADFLRSQAEVPAEELGTVCQALLVLMDVDRCRNPRDWPLMNACLPHAEVVFQRMREVAPAGSEAEVWLGARLDVLLHTRGLVRQATQVGRSLVERARAILGTEHDLTLAVMSNLANSLIDMDAFSEAEALHQQVLETCHRLLGEEHARTLQAKSHLSAVLSSKGDLHGACILQREVLEAQHRILGEDHPNSIETMNNLAETLFHLDRLWEAREMMERALKLTLEVHGQESPLSLTMMNNLAVVLHRQGNHRQALALQEDALEKCRRLLGEEHPVTVVQMNTLATTRESLGDVEGALQLQEQVLEIRRRKSGEEHSSTLVTKANLSLTLKEQGKVQRARALMEEVVTSRRRLFGDEHHETVLTRSHLADMLREKGELVEARTIHEDVLRLRRKAFGDEHPSTASAALSLALTVKAEGDLSRAFTLVKEAWEVFRAVHGLEHENTAAAALLCVSILYERGESPEALTFFTNHLAWILDRSPEHLSPSMNQIRELAQQIASHRSQEGS
jgi:tetratricopeptide (TPR) repeat protein